MGAVEQRMQRVPALLLRGLMLGHGSSGGGPGEEDVGWKPAWRLSASRQAMNPGCYGMLVLAGQRPGPWPRRAATTSRHERRRPSGAKPISLYTPEGCLRPTIVARWPGFLGVPVTTPVWPPPQGPTLMMATSKRTGNLGRRGGSLEKKWLTSMPSKPTDAGGL
ncbi:MAG: hypothetical protein CM15mP128_4080 [Methanobacteriota archaeon]|nr:MAG: hypothetical protein CM15mP128_4080 [Euryarchaeota archaeon]